MELAAGKTLARCGIRFSGQPRLGLAAFSHYVGPAQAHRQPCQRPRGVIPSMGQKELSSCMDGRAPSHASRCPADLNSTTASRACATTTPWGSGTPGRFPRCDERCESSTACRCRCTRRTRRCCTQVTKGARDHGSNHNSDLAVCMWCWVDIVTCGACRPDDLWYYSIKYDDG